MLMCQIMHMQCVIMCVCVINIDNVHNMCVCVINIDNAHNVRYDQIGNKKKLK